MLSLAIAQPDILPYLARPSVWTAVAIAGYALGGALLTVAAGGPVSRALEQDQTPSAKMLRRHGLLEAAYRFWLIAGQGAIIALGYGSYIHTTLARYRIPLLEKAAVLIPFLITVILCWFLDYRFHRAVRTALDDQQGQSRGYWSRGRHVMFNIRHMLLFTIVPVSIILLVTDVLEMHLMAFVPRGIQDPIYLTASLGTAAAVFLIAPVILTGIWRTRTLEPGPLRSDLEDLCARLRFNYRDILVWESDGVIANAAVMGLIAPVRYILVSDGIIDRMDSQHIRAVFAHEGGHVTSHHLGYLMLLAISVMTLCQSAAIFAAELFELPGPVTLALMFASVMLFGWLLFGLVSRQFERQSDVIGAWASAPDPENSPRITHEGAALFAGALQQIAQQNGINQNARNWRHGSIAHRVQYILMLGSTGGTRTAIDRTVRRIKIAIILAAVAAGAAMTAQVQMGL